MRTLSLEGLLVDGVVWLPVSESTRRLLDELCLGNLDGSAPCVEEVVREMPPEARVRDLWAQQVEQESRELERREREKKERESGRAGGDGSSTGQTVPPPVLVIPAPPPLPWIVRMNADEAFFCAYALGALRLAVLGVGDAPARFVDSPNELWTLMTRQRPDFPLLYVAYHHFRARGWIPRTGLQYGADYVIYHAHPGRAHSELVTLVALEDESGGREAAAGTPGADGSATASPALPAVSARRLAWRDVQVTNRLAAQVSKRLLLTTVFLPRGTHGLASPACLESAAVRETLVRRWVPEAHAGV